MAQDSSMLVSYVSALSHADGFNNSQAFALANDRLGALICNAFAFIHAATP